MQLGDQEWCDAVASAAAGAHGSSRFAVAFVVGDAPGGERRFWFAVDGDVVEGGTGDPADPDVTITCDHPTVLAFARGELVAQAAYMQGLLTLKGNMGSLLHNQDALAAIVGAMATVGP